MSRKTKDPNTGIITVPPRGSPSEEKKKREKEAAASF
jgi:hypothetical protein